MAIAWIGFAGAVVAALISGVVAVRQSRMAAEIHKRVAMIDRDLAAEAVLARFREPLAAAAFDLQSRLYNVVRLNFFGRYGGEGHPRAEEALRTTAFRVAQYFGWTEILRREIQGLSFPEDEATREVAHLQWAISKRFLTDEYGSELMIWSDEQRAIGERMIVEENGKVLCMGYATFREHCDDTFAAWCERVRAEIRAQPAQARMLDVQHALCELVEKLDDRHVRYDPQYLTRA